MSRPEPTIYVVPPDLDGQRTDKIVATVAGLSRGRVKELIEAEAITIDDVVVRASQRLAAGVAIAVVVDLEPVEMEAVEVEFGVAYEDDEVIVVDKPAGLVVHPGSGHATGTLINGLLWRYPEQRELGDEKRFGLLHRLDRDTSGLLLVARTQPVYADLRQKLADRHIVRRYLAVVAGHPGATTGTIDAPIARDPSAPTRNTVRVGGRPARTHYRRLAAWDDVSLLAVTLETGRTHQIRVHLLSIDLPVLGDRVYGRVDPRFDPGRTFLHAAELGFATLSGRDHVVKSDLPADLAAVLAELGEPMTGEV